METFKNAQNEPLSDAKDVGRRVNSIDPRVTKIYDWLLKGKARHKIVADGMELWEVSARQVDEYIAFAKQKIVDNYPMDNTREQMYQEALARLDELYWDSVKDGDKKTARAILKDRNELLGLYTTKLDITSGGEKINISVISDDLKKIIDENL